VLELELVVVEDGVVVIFGIGCLVFNGMDVHVEFFKDEKYFLFEFC